MKIAVFIDFDNIEIGVKTTLGRPFDVGTVLEAIKERGEVVTKFAYGDWQRAGDHSRQLTAHAIHMVQRNLTPGGDKNGADINLALDALEMAFTHNHINAFVVVSGDSDFIALVEKLKQYDKKVFVVGGRAFTSVILQKNCNEFIAYENLIGPQPQPRRQVGRGRPAATGDGAQLQQVFPLVKRALQVLSEREVSPQLGLLKSTLLQLDSTFSEREYGASTFRDFVQKLAQAGYVKLKGTDRSVHVELRDGDGAAVAPALEIEPSQTADVQEEARTPTAETPPEHAASQPQAAASKQPVTPQPAEALRAMRRAFQNARSAPRWPMYVRNVKQFVRSVDDTFDERRFGVSNIVDILRIGQREGVFRLDRDRRGSLRVFPGPQLQPAVPPAAVEAQEDQQFETDAADATLPLGVQAAASGTGDADLDAGAAGSADAGAAPVEDRAGVVDAAELPGGDQVAFTDAAAAAETVSEPAEPPRAGRRRKRPAATVQPKPARARKTASRPAPGAAAKPRTAPKRRQREQET